MLGVVLLTTQAQRFVSQMKFLPVQVAGRCCPFPVSAADIAQSSTLEDSIPRWLYAGASVRFRDEGPRGIGLRRDRSR